MRSCRNCGRDITDRAPQAKFCEDAECYRQRMLAHGRSSYDRNRDDVRERQNAAHRARVATKPKKVRLCRYCSNDISHRGGRALWCDLRCRDKARHRADPTRARHRAAQRRGVPGKGISAHRWLRLVRRFNSRCAYCGVAEQQLTQDHVVPISRGGWDTEGNIVPACGQCNGEKADRLLIEWRAKKKGKRPGAIGRRPPGRSHSRS